MNNLTQQFVVFDQKQRRPILAHRGVPTARRVAKHARCRYRSPMFESLRSFEAALKDLPPPNPRWREKAEKRQNALLKPPGSLGRLEDIAVFLAGWGRDDVPRAQTIRLVIFAGNHGVTAQNISPYPSEVTAQMVKNFHAGGAASNALTSAFNMPLDVIAMQLDNPTDDISTTAAMSEDELLSALNTGAGAVRAGDDVLVLGEMGIGNTTIAAALAARALGGDGKDWCGPGTGLDTDGIAHKAQVVDRALAQHANAPNCAAQTLRRVGGRETAAIAGAIVKARHAKMPVLLDGYVVCASLAPLFDDNPEITDHCLAAHLSAEPAHAKLLEAFALKPLLDLGMRLGEGTGAVLASPLLRAACNAHNTMATFDEGQVSGPSEIGERTND